MDLATSGRGGIGPFVGICAIVAAFGVADAHVQGGMVGDMAFMCPEFMQVTLLGILFQLFFHSKRQELCILPHLGCLFLQSFFAGLAASGALTSGLRLITKKQHLINLKMVLARELVCCFYLSDRET